jgi:hypothetical protein
LHSVCSLAGVFLICCPTAALLIACGSDNERSDEPGASATTVVVTQTVTATSTEETTGANELSFEGFKTPSRNIDCVVALGGDLGTEALMRCTIKKVDNAPPRPASCEGDWGHWLTLEAEGPGEWACVSDAMPPDSGYDIVPYGSLWKRGPFTCRSRVAGVRCTNSDGHGFFLSRERQQLF